MEKMKFPKVLIINEVFNSNTGGGITLSSLFANWQKDKIAVVCQSFLLNNADDSICDTFYQLGDKERKFTFPLNLFSSKHHSGLINIEKNTVASNETGNKSLRVKLIIDYLYPFLRYMGIYDFAFKTELSPELCNWLRTYNPDVIYAQAHDLEGVLLVLQIHSFLKKPLVFHMMDDWPSLKLGNDFLNKKQRIFADSKIRELFDKSDLLMSISNEMADEYKKRYKKNFETFHNPIDIDFWKRFQRTTYELPASPTILYAGRTGLGINDSLALFGNVIEKINADLNMSIKFVLQVKEKPEWSFSLKCVEHKNFVDYKQLPRVFAEADFLLLPYDFSKSSLQFIGYSMPTKATEYMISGTPIIIFAPSNTALVKYAKKHEWAKIITENDFEVLYKTLVDLLSNITQRSQIAKNAIKTAEENHSSVKIINMFRDKLTSLSV